MYFINELNSGINLHIEYWNEFTSTYYLFIVRRAFLSVKIRLSNDDLNY